MYSDKPTDLVKANKFSDLYAKRNRHLCEFPFLEAPSVDDTSDGIRHAKHSACGEDGIPYAACETNCHLSAQVLAHCFGDLASGSPRINLIAFNY